MGCPGFLFVRGFRNLFSSCVADGEEFSWSLLKARLKRAPVIISDCILLICCLSKGRGFLFRPVWLGFSSTLNGPTIPSSPNSKQEAVCEIFFAVIPSSLPYEVRCIWLVVIYLICFPHSRLFRTFTQRNEEAWGSLFHFRPDIQTHKIIFIIMLHKRNNTHDTTNERMHASESCVFSQLILSACFSSSLRARSVIMFLVWFSPDVTFVWLAGWLTCFAPHGMKIERILWKCCAPVDLKIF